MYLSSEYRVMSDYMFNEMVYENIIGYKSSSLVQPNNKKYTHALNSPHVHLFNYASGYGDDNHIFDLLEALMQNNHTRLFTFSKDVVMFSGIHQNTGEYWSYDLDRVPNEPLSKTICIVLLATVNFWKNQNV